MSQFESKTLPTGITLKWVEDKERNVYYSIVESEKLNQDKNLNQEL